ncbi:ferritin-like domain-containing protein [Cupriavidus necator]|uniref:Ferritin-like domain-containing protein n=1 Tax=Cupriavidus necator TaxID=106590 RepID=A0A367PHP1_CUPNE|nr:ferritin-like domain-containing protein [Cupriavidus necator]QQX83653.1 ferritin-like domain-containing protein [Cupriavidus necator]RCJ07388.1 ferritin-like domain-containing protein [Cupriavidus necator]
MERMRTTAATADPTDSRDRIVTAPDARRRGLLKAPGLFALGSLAVISLGESMPAWAQTQSGSTRDDINILNTALGLEYQAIAAYQVGAESGLLQKPVLATAVKFQDHHKAHAQVLAGTVSKLGGTPVVAKKASEYTFPTDKLKTQADVLRFAAGLEKGATAAYLGVLPNFYNRELTRAAGSILGDEAMHWAVLLHALGEDPVPGAFVG